MISLKFDFSSIHSSYFFRFFFLFCIYFFFFGLLKNLISIKVLQVYMQVICKLKIS